MTRITYSLLLIITSLPLTAQKPDSIRSEASSTGNLVDELNAPDLTEVISGQKVVWAIIFLLVGYVTIKFLSKILVLLAEKSTRYRITIKSLVPIVKILGWIILVFVVIAGIFQPPAATILAFSASIGVAVGFASQDILRNIFAGIVILLDRPFYAGDKIQVGEHYGEVVEIGLRSTRIVTPDDSLVSVPNSEIMNSAVSNSNSGEANCQVVAEFYLPVDINTMDVREIAIESASVSQYIYLDKPVTVLFFNEIKDKRPYLKMRLKAYVADIRDEFIFKSDMTERVIQALLKEKLLKP